MYLKPVEIIERLYAKKNQRNSLNQMWEELAEVLAPERIGFTTQNRGNRRSDKIYDTAPITAKRSLVNSIGAMLRPKSSAPGKWFDIVPEDEELLEKQAVKDWVDFAEERLWRALYNPKASFIQTTGELDDDLVTFGTSAGFIGIRDDQSGLKFKSFHLKDVYIGVDADNLPTEAYVCEHLTARQAVEKFGEDNVGVKTREALREKNNQDKDKLFEFIWLTMPRYDRDPRIRDNLNMPFMSVVIDVESEHQVLEEGFEEFPFIFPRWDTRSGEVYGRGPGVLALPSVLTLNQMGKTMLRALHRAVDPPWLLPSDSMVNAPQMRPGGVSYYDAKAIRNLGMSKPFQQMTSDAQVPWGLNAQSAEREQIMSVFFKNILNLPLDGPQMTATEVIQRRESFVREIGSVFGALESSYTGPMVERCFGIMMRRGAFGDVSTIPEELQGSEITFRFASPVEKAKRQIEEGTVGQAIDKILAVGQVKPEVMNRINWDEYGRFIAKSNDFPSSLLLDDAQVENIAAAQAQAAEEEMAMQGAERMAGAAKSMGGAPEQLVEGLMPQG